MRHFSIFASIFVLFAATVCGQECGQSFNIRHWAREIKLAKENTKQLKILGGTISPLHAWPWVVLTATEDQIGCSGSIIHENWVLCAKHCFSETDFVYYGENVVREGTRIDVLDRYYPEEDGNNHDILLLRLNGSIAFSKTVQPICMRREISEREGDFDVAAGYGVYILGNPNGGTEWEMQPYVRESIIPLHRPDHGMCGECTYDDKTEICAGDYGEGTTQGDSGGPLMSLIDGKWYQHGVVSRGIYGQGVEDTQMVRDEGIYTDATKFCDWIAETTENDVVCE